MEDATPTPDRLVESALAELQRGSRNFLPWALRYGSTGDPLPRAWGECSNVMVMCELLGWIHPDALIEVLESLDDAKEVYPHARESFRSAVRELRLGRANAVSSWISTALVHYPGRGTARPQPEKAERLQSKLRASLLHRVPTVTLAELG